MMQLGLYPGWIGIHTRAQAPGAMPNGTRIVKAALEAGDAHPLGSAGRIIGSIAADYETARRFDAPFFYFVEWDDAPRIAIGVNSAKIKCADE
jgi:hypothetical protein